MKSGYVPLRRGLQEHVVDGRISILEYAVYVWMIQSADDSSGVWWGSARALACQVSITDRQARGLLESLERKGYLKRFAKKRSRANYSVVINRFVCSRGAYRNLRVNIENTVTCDHISYEDAPTDGVEQSLEATANSRLQHAPIQEKELKPTRKIKTNPCEQEPLADPLADNFALFWEAWPTPRKAKFSAWSAFKRIPIAEFLPIMAALERQKTSEAWRDPKFRPYPATWLNGKRWLDEVESGKPATDREASTKRTLENMQRFVERHSGTRPGDSEVAGAGQRALPAQR